MRDIAFRGPREMVLCLTDFGLWSSEDDGESFREWDVGRIFGFQSSSACAVRGETTVASLGSWSKKGLKVSADRGESWYEFELPDAYRMIAFHPQRDDVVYAGSYRSDDSGKNWKKLQRAVYALYRGDGDMVYAAEPDGQGKTRVLRSSDRGEAWAKEYPDVAFSERDLMELAVSPVDPDWLIAATASGVWVYDGKRWHRRTEEHGLTRDKFDMMFVQSVAIDPRNAKRVYVGRRAGANGESNGVFRSCDGGMTWENVNGNLGDTLTVWSVRISPFTGEVFLGTSFGTFRGGLDASEQCGR
jgi:photosystem II stability/assembly factor-like uncharacterized protein